MASETAPVPEVAHSSAPARRPKGPEIAQRALLRVARLHSIEGVARGLEGRPESALLAVAEVDSRLALLEADSKGLASDVARHLLEAGGKRIRPLLCLLAGRAVAGPGRAVPAGLASLAQAAELVHCASLLHDDVIDVGETRRGRPAPRVVFGNAASVLGGDLLLVQALALTEQVGVPEALSRLLETLGQMVEAESLQLERRGRVEISEQDYFEIVGGKTAALFEWCAEVGGRAAGGSPAQVQALASFGSELGVAFQLLDDLLDLQGDAAEVGKAVLQDLDGGTLTFPVIRAARNRPQLRSRLRSFTDGAGEAEVAEGLAEAIEQAGGIAAARREVSRRTELARAELVQLPDTPARQALHALAGQLAERAR